VYQDLYSPAALAETMETRAARATKLAQDFEQFRQQRPMPDFSAMAQDRETIFPGIVGVADTVNQLSILTLIHRSIPQSFDKPHGALSPRCVDYARQALAIHHNCYALVHKTNKDMYEGYLHWSVILAWHHLAVLLISHRAVLHAPFTPYIVLFCNVISNLDTSDLNRMAMFLSTLDAPDGSSESVKKFYRVCHVFYQVGAVYIQGKTQTAAGYATQGEVTMPDAMLGSSSSWSQFDQYLNVLGFGPGTSGESTANAQEGWFQGNQHVMGLMEQDLSYLDGSMI